MICIDFSGDYIDVVVSSGTKKKLTVETGLTLKAPPEVFTAGGDVDFGVLENCLRPTLEQIAEKKVVMTFSFLPTIYSVLNLHKERNRQQQRVAVESQVFANISPDEYYVDYFVAQGKEAEAGKQTFVTYAMPKKVVNGCYEMLAKLDKTPVALVPSQFAAQSFVETFFADKTVALAKLGSKNITLHLMNPPDNMITRDIVIESAAATLDVLANINASSEPQTVFVQNIEKLISYQNIKFPGKTIEKILVYGHSANDELVNFVNTSLGLTSELLPKLDGELSNAASVYTMGAALSSGVQQINFFNKNKSTKSEQKTATRKANVPLVVACAIVIVNIVVSLILTMFNMQAQALVSARQEELSSPETLALIEEYGSLRRDFVSLYKSEQALMSLEAQIESIGEFNRNTLNQIVLASPEGVEVASASFSSNTYNLICTGTTEQQASDYVAILTNMDMFDYVGYFGYSETGTEVSFTVVCELKQ